MINAAHQRGTRVVLTISVFAWTSGEASVQKALLGSSTARTNLARQAAAAVRDRGADGINLDFEPLASGYADEFVLFLKAVRTELNRIKAGYQLTYDTTGYIGNYPIEASVGSGAADAIFIMGYDYRTAGAGTAGSIDPLSGPTYDLTDTVRAYTARVAPSRVILGLPWYGRAWSTTTSAVRSTNQSGTKFGSSTTVNYETLTDLVDQYGRRWDPVEQSPYVAYQRQNCTSAYGCVTSWRQLYYDDAARRCGRGCRWSTTTGSAAPACGRSGTTAAIRSCIAPTRTRSSWTSRPRRRASSASRGVQGDEGFVVTWAAADISAIASYDVQVSVDGGAWADWLRATKATSDVWLGRDGTGYAFRVRARDTKGNTGAWNVTRGVRRHAEHRRRRVRPGRDRRARRTASGPDTSAAKLGTMAADTIVAFTAGPVSADGYTWYEVTQPVTAWGPVGFVERGVWVATKSPDHEQRRRVPRPRTARGSTRGSSASTSGRGPRRWARPRPPWRRGRSRPTATARGTRSGCAGRTPWRWTRCRSGSTRRRARSWARSRCRRSPPAPGRGTGTGASAAPRVGDGRYMLQLVGVAGGKTYNAPSARPVTTAQVAAYGITVDTTPPAVTSASATAVLLSPNGDAFLDTVRLALATTGASRWTIGVTNAAGTSVRSLAGTGGSVTWTWNGTGDAGSRVPDGRYARHARHLGRRRQPRLALVPGHRRHDGTHRSRRTPSGRSSPPTATAPRTPRASRGAPRSRRAEPPGSTTAARWSGRGR